MGAKTCLVAHVQGDARRILAERPTLDEAATADFVASLFPDARFGAPQPADLSCTWLEDKRVVAGCFPGLRIFVSPLVAVESAEDVTPAFIATQGTTILHAMHSVSDWLAFGVWQDGVLVRWLDVSPDAGVVTDIGEHLPFEKPYWDGAHPAVDPAEEPNGYPLPFHPLELGEAALRAFFGFQIEGLVDATLLEPETIPMLRFGDPVRARARTGPAVPMGAIALGAIAVPCLAGAIAILCLPSPDAPAWLTMVGVALLVAGAWMGVACVGSIRDAARP